MPIVLIAYPFLEFWSLLEFSARAGAFATLSYIAFMMVVGYWMLRAAGRSALTTAGRFTSASAIRGQLFASELSVAMAAVMLMIPGLISDGIAVLLLTRGLFFFIHKLLSGENRARQTHDDSLGRPESDADGPVTLEGQYHRVDDD
ncbi:MAG: FxsA family protein [Luminiphilus sp.]|nr:FxsA family protein [Luminiphilus sp.]